MSQRPKRVLVLWNERKPDVRARIDALADWFAERCEIHAIAPAAGPLPAEAQDVEFCVVFGGDGTLLSAARMLSGTAIPLLGVNMGKLGFLADFSLEHFQKHFDEILDGQISPTNRLMLDVSVTNCVVHGFCSAVANDVAISAGAPFRMIDLRVEQGGVQIARYLGDGLIVSTPTGSTAYNMSAGGPIMAPTLEAVAITPIAPHTLSMRPIVVGADEPICITATSVNEGTTLIVDGQRPSGLCSGDQIEVARAAAPLRIIPHPRRAFFDTLTDKLQWGRSPHHLDRDG